MILRLSSRESIASRSVGSNEAALFRFHAANHFTVKSAAGLHRAEESRVADLSADQHGRRVSLHPNHDQQTVLATRSISTEDESEKSEEDTFVSSRGRIACESENLRNAF